MYMQMYEPLSVVFYHIYMTNICIWLGIYSRICPMPLGCLIQHDSMICDEHKAIHSFIQSPIAEHKLLPFLAI